MCLGATASNPGVDLFFSDDTMVMIGLQLPVLLKIGVVQQEG